MIETIKCSICGKELKVEMTGIEKGHKFICPNHTVDEMMEN